MNPIPHTPDPLDGLRPLRQLAPPDFAQRVLAALPAEPDPTLGLRLRRVWPREHGRWILPALAGAAAAMLFTTFLLPPPPPAETPRMTVHFELHAPDASQVELVGTFTDWQVGRIHLAGPDASGHWTVNVNLSAGRHEYSFLVDGQLWMTDPDAEIRRDDGFGHQNAVLEI